MLVDHVSNLPPSQEAVVYLSALRFDTYSPSEMNTREKLLQCRRNHRIQQIVVGEIFSPSIDRDVKKSSIDFAISTSLIVCTLSLHILQS